MRIKLEDRLIDFSVKINTLILRLKNCLLANNLSKQIIRSSTSAALNYGEAQGAESRNDFIHKNSIVLKELRETEICLKILLRSQSAKYPSEAEDLINENRQLIAIFQKTINTLKSRNKWHLSIYHFVYCILNIVYCILQPSYPFGPETCGSGIIQCITNLP